jgi:hypothetical protein
MNLSAIILVPILATWLGIDIDPMAYKEGAHEALIELEMMSGSLGMKGQDFHEIVVLGDNARIHNTLFENVDMSRSNLRGVEPHGTHRWPPSPCRKRPRAP